MQLKPEDHPYLPLLAPLANARDAVMIAYFRYKVEERDIGELETLQALLTIAIQDARMRLAASHE